jgi:hypothetical protein
VMQRIDNQNAVEESVGKRESLHLRLHRMQRRFFASASQHLTRLIADDQTADEWAQSGSDAPRAAAGIEQPSIGRETQERGQARRIGWTDQPVVHRRQNVKMIEHLVSSYALHGYAAV